MLTCMLAHVVCVVWYEKLGSARLLKANPLLFHLHPYHVQCQLLQINCNVHRSAASCNDRRPFTIFFLEHCPQFGNFAEINFPPLLILRHDHIRFSYIKKCLSTKHVLHYVAESCYRKAKVLYLSGEC